jgi:hypothetical protein
VGESLVRGCGRVIERRGGHTDRNFEGNSLGRIENHQAGCECVGAYALGRALEFEATILREISGFHGRRFAL